MLLQYAEGSSLTNWKGFSQLEEVVQCRFLLDVASAAWKKQNGFDVIKSKVQAYIELGYEVLEGESSDLPQLIKFLDDPEMIDDFGSYFEILSSDENAAAALDLASYACGFVSRVVAEKTNYGPLPDPVLEALPDVSDYFKERAELIGL